MTSEALIASGVVFESVSGLKAITDHDGIAGNFLGAFLPYTVPPVGMYLRYHWSMEFYGSLLLPFSGCFPGVFFSGIMRWKDIQDRASARKDEVSLAEDKVSWAEATLDRDRYVAE